MAYGGSDRLYDGFGLKTKLSESIDALALVGPTSPTVCFLLLLAVESSLLFQFCIRFSFMFLEMLH